MRFKSENEEIKRKGKDKKQNSAITNTEKRKQKIRKEGKEGTNYKNRGTTKEN